MSREEKCKRKVRAGVGKCWKATGRTYTFTWSTWKMSRLFDQKFDLIVLGLWAQSGLVCFIKLFVYKKSKHKTKLISDRHLHSLCQRTIIPQGLKLEAMV